MKQHARFSPSKLEELEKCPKFKRNEEEANTRGSAADEGTLLHESFEKQDLSGLDDEQKSAVDTAIQYANGVRAKMVAVISDRTECKLEIPGLTWGFADRVIIGIDAAGKRYADVMDAKFGRKGASAAVENFQVQAYSAAVFIEQEKAGTPLDYAVGHIIAPRVPGAPEPATYTKDLVPATIARIEALYAKLEHPFVPPVADEDLCAMCKWASSCPAMNQTVSVVTKGVGLPTPEVFAPDAMVSSKDRMIAVVVAKALKNWADQVVEANTEFAKQGGDVPGFKLQSRSLGAKVPNDMVAEAVKRLTNAGYTLERLLPGIRLSIPELAKSEQERNGTTEKEEREVILGVLGQDCVQTGSTQFLTKVRKFDWAATLAGTGITTGGMALLTGE